MKEIEIEIGGLTKEALLKRLDTNNIQINPLGEKLLQSELLQISEMKKTVVLTKLTLRELGLPTGKTGLLDIIGKAHEVGLEACLPEVAPFLRLASFKDTQSYGFEKKHRTPHGSVTVVSEILDEDPDFPKGFYLRKVDEDYWLRGYICDYEHQFSLDETFIFMSRIKK